MSQLEPTHLPEECPTCKFVGKLSIVDGHVYDLYRCGDGFVARHGPEGEYLSNTGHGGGLTLYAPGWRAVLYREGESDHARL